jgi:hypothetical protein
MLILQQAFVFLVIPHVMNALDLVPPAAQVAYLASGLRGPHVRGFLTALRINTSKAILAFHVINSAMAVQDHLLLTALHVKVQHFR